MTACPSESIPTERLWATAAPLQEAGRTARHSGSASEGSADPGELLPGQHVDDARAADTAAQSDRARVGLDHLSDDLGTAAQRVRPCRPKRGFGALPGD